MKYYHCYAYLFVAVVFFFSPVFAQTAHENIALDRPYTYSAPPSYALCTDPDDPIQLTDGVDTEGYFWTQPGTVGWANQLNVTVTIDLGSDVAIRGVSLRTAAGSAGVAWPSGIRLFVAGEDQQFRLAGDLLALNASHGEPSPEPYAVHRYWTDAMETHGRYVAFVVTNQPFTFIDELEVFAGDPGWLSAPVPGRPIEDIAEYLSESQTWDGIARRLRLDGAVIRARAEAKGVSEVLRDSILQELDAITVAAQPDFDADYSDFRAILPLNPWHTRQFACQAQLWRAAGLAEIVPWQNDLWAPLDHLATPPNEGTPTVQVAMMDNEYRAASLNLSNTTEETQEFHVDIEGLPGGTNPDYITIHEVIWTDTASGVPVASALPEANRTDTGSWVIQVPSGMTRQLWFTFYPQGVAPGTYRGHIALRGVQSQDVPLEFICYPLRFPDNPTLSFGGWDYTDGEQNRGINANNRDAVIADLKAHYVDSPWATGGVLPQGVHDGEGHMTMAPDTARFDEWIGRWPQATNYCIFPAVGDHFGDWTMDTPAFKTAVGEWARFWATHAKSKGIEARRLCVLLLDEPHEPAQDQIIIAWATAINEAGVDFTIWEDPTYQGVSDSQAALAEVCDVLCPNRPIFLKSNEAYRDFFRGERDKGTRLEFYSCSGPTTRLDPYSYFRLQAWSCWVEGASASYFWAFGDNADGSSWNEYVLPRNIYTLTFLDDTSVTPAKMLEAAREGIEDYEYFVMLQQAIDAAPPGAARDQAIRVLAEVPGAVLAAGESPSLMWNEDLDRSLADAGRIRVLDALVALSSS